MKKLICLVTGASSGIGREISLELSKKAKHIYITSRDVENLEKLSEFPGLSPASSLSDSPLVDNTANESE